MSKHEESNNNCVNLCESCCNIQPNCDGMSESGNIIFGDGVGLDNIIACSYYEALEIRHPKHKGQQL